MLGGDGWRYLAQRIDGEGGLGGFLDLNLPLDDVSIEEVLSGHNGFTARINAEVQRLKTPDGRPILQEWGTAIWAEAPDGEIRGGGIVEVITENGPQLEIDCVDLSGSMIGLPYVGADHFINVDPIDLFRHIWLHAQSQSGGNYGITFDRTKSPIMLGGNLIQRVDFDTEPDPTLVEGDDTAETGPLPAAPSRFATNKAWRERGVQVMKARNWKADVVDAALVKWLNKDDLKAAGKWTALTERENTIKKKVVEAIGWPPVPPTGALPNSLVVNMRPQMWPPGQDPEATDPDTGEKVVWDYDAYKLNWYTNLDLDSDISDLAAATPFDWHLTHAWYENEIRHHIRIGYPSLGRRRDELRFVIGENIKVMPTVERDGTKWASEVLVLGAGEGSAQVVGRAYRPRQGRPRRVAVVSAPWIQDNAMATNYATSQLSSRNNVEDVQEIVLHNHPHAPMGSVDLGDEILLQGETNWTDLEVWVRVVGRSMSPSDSDSMTLTVLRTDRIG